MLAYILIIAVAMVSVAVGLAAPLATLAIGAMAVGALVWLYLCSGFGLLGH